MESTGSDKVATDYRKNRSAKISAKIASEILRVDPILGPEVLRN